MKDSASSPSLERYGLTAVLLVIAVAVAIRIPGMTQWWLNPDEGIYFSALTEPTAASFWAEVARNSHPPLYYLILRAMGFLTTNFLWFRGLSLVSGAVAVFFFWRCARELTPAPQVRSVIAGMVAAVLLICSPLATVLSEEMRQYMLQLALVAAALASLLRYGREPRRQTLVWYVALLCLALFTHYSTILVMGAFGGVGLYLMARGGMSAADRRNLVLVHLIPVLEVAGLYVFHLRKLAASSLANDALHGWLSFYMVRSPKMAWLAFVGLQTAVLGRPMGGVVTVLMLGALVLAVVRRQWLPLVLAGSALVVGLAAAALDVYPMGSTRHSIWMLTFTVPVLAWATATVLTSGRWRALALLASVAVLVVARRPVADAVGVPSAPWAASDRVLRRSDLLTLLDVVDPNARPRLEVMDQQTYDMLMPFYATARRAARPGPSDTFIHFAYGHRDIVVAQSWLLTAGPDSIDAPGNLRSLPSRVQRADPALGMASAKQVEVLVGGWRTQVVDQLLALQDSGVVVSHRLVPGLFTFVVDAEKLARRYGPSTPP